MKKVLLLMLAFSLSFALNAQIQTPAPSSFQKIEQKVGLTDVSLEYSRPNMRGRTIFGGLVPYDKVWRTGANARTKVTFSEDVMINGTALKAGSYAIFTKPSAKSWEVYFYTEANGGGTPREWDDTKVAAKVTANVIELPMEIETFTISFDDIMSDSANIGLMWSNVYVPVKIDVHTDKAVMAAIDKTMSGPGAGDYYAAAVYYLNEGKDINQAKMWIDKAMAMIDKPAFWQYRQQSLIYAKAGDKKGAIEAAKKSLAGAKEAGNDDYIKMNTDSLAEWNK